MTPEGLRRLADLVVTLGALLAVTLGALLAVGLLALIIGSTLT